MNTWYYNFAVEYYESVNGGMNFANGIVAGSNYGDALAKVNEFFGEENIESLYMETLTDGAIVFDDSKAEGKSFKEYMIKMDKIEYEVY